MALGASILLLAGHALQQSMLDSIHSFLTFYYFYLITEIITWSSTGDLNIGLALGTPSRSCVLQRHRMEDSELYSQILLSVSVN